MSSISIENYLSIIYKYRNETGGIKGNVIAEKLHISNSAVTDMLKKLAKAKLIEYTPYKEIRLTETGESSALNLVRRHRIWEIFLHRIVKLPWEMVHEEAERLEHHSSDALINRLDEMLNFPEFDPHGAPIPGKDGGIPKQKKLKKLSEVLPPQTAIVKRVNDFDPNFLTYISNLGVSLQSEIKVLDIMEFDKSLFIEIHNQKVNISSTIAENIFVIVKKL